MRSSFTAALALTLVSGPALAGACGPDAEADLPVLEELKSAFLASEYREFSGLLGPMFGPVDAIYDQYFPVLERVFPEGFDRCLTVLQRREAPGFFQDVVLFYPRGRTGPLALLLVAVADGDRVIPIEFNYNTTVSDVLSDIK